MPKFVLIYKNPCQCKILENSNCSKVDSTKHLFIPSFYISIYSLQKGIPESNILYQLLINPPKS